MSQAPRACRAGRIAARRSCAALMLAAISACHHNPPVEKFESTAPGGQRIVDLISWLGSIEDLTNSAEISDKLGVSPHFDTVYWDVEGRHIPNWIDVLSYASLPDTSGVKISYRVLLPDGLAANGMKPKPGIVARASFQLSIRDPHTCVRKDDMMARFGSPAETNLLTDGGGYAYGWLVGAHGRWHTYANTSFGPDGVWCANFIGLMQTTA